VAGNVKQAANDSQRLLSSYNQLYNDFKVSSKKLDPQEEEVEETKVASPSYSNGKLA